MTNSGLIEKRIDLLRSLMIFGVVILHTPPYVPIAQTGPSFFDFVVALFQQAVFRTTVPVLTFISGYLLFRSSLDTQPLRLLRKKFSSIVIPFIIFNFSVLALLIILRQVGGINAATASLNNTEDWMNAAFGLTAGPINYPLHFLRNLVALFILAPVIGFILRNAAWAGLVLALIVFRYNLDGDFITRDTMTPVFYLGGMAAVLRWNMHALDRFAMPLLFAFFGACCCIVCFRIANTSYLQIAAPLLIWPASSLLVSTYIGTWLAKMSKYSYFLFLAHAPVVLLVSIVYKKFQFIPFPIYWVVTPVIVAGILVKVYDSLARGFPSAFNFMIGNNLRRVRPVVSTYADRRRVPRPSNAPVYTTEMRLAMARQ